MIKAIKIVCSELIENKFLDAYTKAIAQVTLGQYDLEDMLSQSRYLLLQTIPAREARVLRRVLRKAAN